MPLLITLRCHNAADAATPYITTLPFYATLPPYYAMMTFFAAILADHWLALYFLRHAAAAMPLFIPC